MSNRRRSYRFISITAAREFAVEQSAPVRAHWQWNGSFHAAEYFPGVIVGPAVRHPHSREDIERVFSVEAEKRNSSRIREARNAVRFGD